MLLLCLFAILVSVQCAPQDYPKLDNFNLKDVNEEFQKEIMQSQYGVVVNNARFRRSVDGTVSVTYAFQQTISDDIRLIINNILLPYVQENTCLQFEEISLKSVDTTDSKHVFVFLETKEKLENCFAFIERVRNNGGSFLSVKLNEECVRQMLEELRAGKTVRTDYVDQINDSYCR